MSGWVPEMPPEDEPALFDGEYVVVLTKALEGVVASLATETVQLCAELRLRVALLEQVAALGWAHERERLG